MAAIITMAATITMATTITMAARGAGGPTTKYVLLTTPTSPSPSPNPNPNPDPSPNFNPKQAARWRLGVRLYAAAYRGDIDSAEVSTLLTC